jgi:hypothetical protein
MLPLAEDLTNEAAQDITIENVTESAGAETSEVRGRMQNVAPATDERKGEGAVKSDDPAKSDDAAKSGEESMASSAERMTILRMIEQGKISAEEGARLLSALGKGQEAESNARPNAFDATRQVQVRVSDLGTNRQKVNVTLPVGLLQLAWNWLPSSTKVQFEQVQVALNSGAVGRLVEVIDQDTGVRVEINVL